MARKPTKEEVKPVYGTCRQCALSYDYHERTAYPPHDFFMCKCPHERWSQFLDKMCVNGHFISRTK